MKPRVLVIEDDPVSMELLTYLLRNFGYETLQALDGEQGVTIAHDEAPDLVICDIRLPGMSGEAVAERLKHDPKLSAVPLIAVTAYAMVGDRQHFLSAGFDGYIPKPILPETFVAQISRFIHQPD